MPELPELEALRLTLGPALTGRTTAEVQLNPRKSFLLRAAPETFVAEVPGRTIALVHRRGKHLVFDLDRDGDVGHLVVNPMLGGRLHLAADAARRGAAWCWAIGLVGGGELRYLDYRDMGRVHWTRDLDQVPAWSEMGPEADTVAQQGLDWFRARLRRHRDELKDLLRNQSFLAGIGNAYSDEILFEAGLLPLRRRATLGPDEEEALFRAIDRVLSRSVVTILANPGFVDRKQDRSFMAVHGRGGQDCPRCGHRVSQLGPDRSPLNFCRGCQH
ncbi:MAG: DNA-formamidopyrimidine glycosylase family protein [Candidatus Dormibacteria bacterium]